MSVSHYQIVFRNHLYDSLLNLLEHTIRVAGIHIADIRMAGIRMADIGMKGIYEYAGTSQGFVQGAGGQLGLVSRHFLCFTAINVL